jgi:DNA-binding NarL/FixJ family response regulator
VKAIQYMREVEPSIVLLDLGLRNQSSLEFVKLIKKDFQKVKVIVMDLVPLQEDVIIFIQAGVSGFILKDANVVDFIETIRQVAKGIKVLPPYLTETLFSQIIGKALVETDHSKIIESVSMTKREHQVIDLVSDGLSNKEIGQMLHLSTYTIKSHIHNILEKLAIHTRVQIAKYANTSDGYSTGKKLSSIDE